VNQCNQTTCLVWYRSYVVISSPSAARRARLSLFVVGGTCYKHAADTQSVSSWSARFSGVRSARPGVKERFSGVRSARPGVKDNLGRLDGGCSLQHSHIQYTLALCIILLFSLFPSYQKNKVTLFQHMMVEEKAFLLSFPPPKNASF
jgi:hypothetical protein